MSSGRSIAAAQTVPVAGDIAANVERHLESARAAAAERARVLVFPELSLTGYELDFAADLAFVEDDPRLEPLVESVASLGITMVAGAPIRIGERLHIAAFILAPDRSIDVYTKHHLGTFSADANPGGDVPPAESTVFDPGGRNPLVGFGDGGTAAVAVCADTGRPSHPEAAAARGANTYLAGMFVIPSDLERDAANLAAYAKHHSMAVALANFGGPSGGLPAAGGSAIWSDRGEPLARIDGTGAGVVWARERAEGWTAGTVAL